MNKSMLTIILLALITNALMQATEPTPAERFLDYLENHRVAYVAFKEYTPAFETPEPFQVLRYQSNASLYGRSDSRNQPLTNQIVFAHYGDEYWSWEPMGKLLTIYIDKGDEVEREL